MTDIVRQLALHRVGASTILVSRVAERRVFALPTRLCAYAHVAGRWVEGARGVKLALVDVTLPEWLARKEGLL